MSTKAERAKTRRAQERQERQDMIDDGLRWKAADLARRAAAAVEGDIGEYF